MSGSKGSLKAVGTTMQVIVTDVVEANTSSTTGTLEGATAVEYDFKLSTYLPTL
jgi:hypothetical protein